jgi:hypothetical protein
MNEIFLLARETVKVIFHLDGGYTRVAWERSENTAWAGTGWTFDIPTHVIPYDLRAIGSRFLLSIIKPNPNDRGNVGKFWVYEQAIRVPYYGIYEVAKAQVEVYHLIDNNYQLMKPNERGHYPIAPMGVELGIWQGFYLNAELPWLRWWDAQGNLLLTGEERAEVERQKRERIVDKLRSLSAEQLNALGIDPEMLD